MATVEDAGHRYVDSDCHRFYLDTSGGRGTPLKMWTDISRGSSLQLGGEVSMWSDAYVPPHDAKCLFQSPERDDNFAKSVSSTIWPRSALAAGAFWRYNESIEAESLVTSVMNLASERLAARGLTSCPCISLTDRGCNQTQFCGTAYCVSPHAALV